MQFNHDISASRSCAFLQVMYPQPTLLIRAERKSLADRAQTSAMPMNDRIVAETLFLLESCEVLCIQHRTLSVVTSCQSATQKHQHEHWPRTCYLSHPLLEVLAVTRNHLICPASQATMHDAILSQVQLTADGGSNRPQASCHKLVTFGLHHHKARAL